MEGGGCSRSERGKYVFDVRLSKLFFRFMLKS